MQRRGGSARRALSRAALGGGLVVAACLLAAPAFAFGPVVSGSATGLGRAGDRMIFRVTAQESGGGTAIQTLQVALLLHSVVLDEVDVDLSKRTVGTPTTLAQPLSSTATQAGQFFRVTGRDVRVGGSGRRLSASISPVLVHDIPAGTVATLGAIDDVALVGRVTRSITVEQPSAGGSSWGTIALAFVVALFLGGFVGNLFSSARSRAAAPTGPSIYEAITRRMKIEDERPARRAPA